MRFSLRGTVLFVPVVPDVTGIFLSLIALSCFRAGQGTFFFFFFLQWRTVLRVLVIPDVTGSILSLRYPVSMQDRTLFFFFFFFFFFFTAEDGAGCASDS